MMKNHSTKRTLAGIALAVAGVAAAGMLAIGSASAQGSTGVNPLGSPLQTPRAGVGHGGHGIIGRELDIVAQALGIDEAALKAELESGRSIAEIAASRNLDVAAVIDAVVADRQAQLAQAVADGKLTQAQADEKLAKFETQVTRAVNVAPPVGGPREPRHPRNPEAAQPTAASGTVTGAAATVAPPPAEQNGGAAATAAPPPQGEQNGGRGGNGGNNNGGGRGGNNGGNGGGNNNGGGRGPRR